MLPIAINQVTAARHGYAAFLDLAAHCGADGVELRTDLGPEPFGGELPEKAGTAVTRRGLRVHALAEVKAFNAWDDERERQARRLIDLARRVGAAAIALIPRNDGRGMGNGERQANLRLALRELEPLLRDAGLVGLVEPLGFESSSLRRKEEAIDAIVAVQSNGRFRIVHDTFHHHLAGGGAIFPEHTGMVHVSAVLDPDPATSEMLDGHRVLPAAGDRLGSMAQITALLEAGYSGPISIEAFARSVHEADNLAADLGDAFEFIRSQLPPPNGSGDGEMPKRLPEVSR